MSDGDKNDLLASLSSNITDNNNNENTAARHRTYASRMITYLAGLAELTKQTFLGPIGFSDDVTFVKNPTYLGNDIYQAPLPVAYCDYSFTPTNPQQLTPTPTAVTGWDNSNPNVLSVGVTVSGSEFYCSVLGVLRFDLERVYRNDDNNPASIVNITIAIVKNGNDTLFTATLPISSATANDEPAVEPFTTPFLIKVDDNTSYYEVYVSAEDGGSTPQDTNLVRMKLVANMIAAIPESN